MRLALEETTRQLLSEKEVREKSLVHTLAPATHSLAPATVTAPHTQHHTQHVQEIVSTLVRPSEDLQIKYEAPRQQVR